MDHRYVELVCSYKPGSTRLTVQGPSSAGIYPPGSFFLSFLAIDSLIAALTFAIAIRIVQDSHGSLFSLMGYLQSQHG